jgi:hypothetical protein
MSLSAIEILQVMEKAKELGVTNIEVEGFKASFGPTISQVKETVPQLSAASPQLVASPVVPELDAEDIMKPMSVFDEMTDEEILFYSTPYYDELLAKKELMQQAKDLEGKQ